jgi:pimeloyl-ACP methyl ester carboxylesterase
VGLFAVTTVFGLNWNASLSRREQENWDEHAAFMDQLVVDGLVFLGGPIGDSERNLLIIEATAPPEIETRMAEDPWASKPASNPKSPSGTAYVTMDPMDAERVTYAGFEGLHLVADVRGDPDAWPVLFLHGGGQTRHAWGSTAETVAAQGWRTVALDLRGHGDSDWASNGDYSFTAFCADVVAVADQLGRPPVLVGASLGGMSALLAEGTSDRPVSSGLVLVDITPKANPAGIERIKNFMLSGVDGFDTLEDAAEAIAGYTPQRTRQFNPTGLMKVLRKRDGRWYWHWDPKFIDLDRTEVVPDRLAGLLDVAMSNIQVPTLLVRGLLSDVVTQQGVDELLAQIPGSAVVDVAGAAHMIAGDRNDAFSEAVISFLEDRIRPLIG